ncbi:hypothetical protein CsatB_022597 [Cannabis sativa]
MAAPNMATITASLEQSFQNCSLNNSAGEAATSRRVVHGIGRRSSSSSSASTNQDEELAASHQNHHHQTPDDNTTLELNSHISLPYHWEQCLDLKTGEIYYINWRNGMKAKEDPRTKVTTEYINNGNGNGSGNGNGDYYYSEEEEEEEEEDDSSYDSEESSSESSPPPSAATTASRESLYRGGAEKDHVLVVGGCKSCFMYFMVPKQVQECPKCCGQLLHFDRSQNGSL